MKCYLNRCVFVSLAVLICGTSSVFAATTAKLIPRPLTAQEVKSYPAGTRTAAGVNNTGLGQPIYLDALITKNVVVTGATWTLVSWPAGSKAVTNKAAVLLNSPLTNTLLSYDGGDRKSFDVASRRMLIPDVEGNFFEGTNYTVVVRLAFSNQVLVVTNTFYGAIYYGLGAKTNSAGAAVANLCVLCHADKTNGFAQTAHAATTNQCENCHGPADQHLRSLGENLEAVGASLSAGNCGQCHDNQPQKVVNYQWSQSLHATGEVFRSQASCNPCHSTVGFLGAHDAAFNPATNLLRGSYNEGVTCAACHDPHTPGVGSQVRAFPSVTLSNGVVNIKGNMGLACMQCHHDRRNAEAQVLANTATAPHHSPQTDMMLGTNAIEYGQDLPRSRHIDVLFDACVDCHMQPSPTSGPALNHVGVHTWKMRWTDPTGTTNVYQTALCQDCHGAVTNFDFGRFDWNQDGKTNGIQTEIRSLLTNIAARLPGYPTNTTSAGALSNISTNWTLKQRRAAYNYMFVWEDRSYGVHNAKYAAALLQTAISDLMGLPLAVPVPKAGDPSSQQKAQAEYSPLHVEMLSAGSGSSPNAQQHAVPLLTDTLIMRHTNLPASLLQAYGMPLLSNLPATVPAIQLGYLPSREGVPMHFQACCPTGGSFNFQSLDPGFTSATDRWFFLLVPAYDCSQKFYRVSSP